MILDTNLWISFLISGRFKDLDELLLEGKIKLIFSQESVEEFLTVAKRPKFGKYFSYDNIKDLLRMFDKYGKLIDVTISVDACRDYKDNFLLSLAVESKADFLISGDADLLVMKKFKKTKILSWTDFLDEFK